MTSEPRKSTASSSKKKKDTATTDHDSPWKEALEYYFQDFLELLFAEIAQAINWQHPPEFLDKELQKIVNQSPEGRQYADTLHFPQRQTPRLGKPLARTRSQPQPLCTRRHGPDPS